MGVEQCLSVNGTSVDVRVCNKGDVMQMWTWDQKQLKSAHSGLCLQVHNSTTDEPLVLGSCDPSVATSWFYDRLAYPLDLLRTMDEAAPQNHELASEFRGRRRSPKPTLPPTPTSLPQRKCLSASRGPIGSQCSISLDMIADDKDYELLGKASSAGECCELCSSYTGPAWSGPESSKLHLSIVHWKCHAFIYDDGVCKGMKGPLQRLKRKRGAAVGVAPANPAPMGGSMGPPPPGGQSICDRVVRRVPEIDVGNFSGPMKGFVRAKFNLQVNYSLLPPRLSCGFLDFEIPEVDMHLFGGGPFHKCADGMKWNIASAIQTIMPGAAAAYLAKRCPEGGGIAVPQCSEAASRGPLELVTCLFASEETPWSKQCLNPPCYGCKDGKCSQVRTGANGSTASLEDCALGCTGQQESPMDTIVAVV